MVAKCVAHLLKFCIQDSYCLTFWIGNMYQEKVLERRLFTYGVFLHRSSPVHQAGFYRNVFAKNRQL